MVIFLLDYIPTLVYNYTCKAEVLLLMEGSEEMDDGMTNVEFRVLLEMLAQLVESKAETVQEAVELIRQFKSE